MTEDLQALNREALAAWKALCSKEVDNVQG